MGGSSLDPTLDLPGCPTSQDPCHTQVANVSDSNPNDGEPTANAPVVEGGVAESVAQSAEVDIILSNLRADAGGFAEELSYLAGALEKVVGGLRQRLGDEGVGRLALQSMPAEIRKEAMNNKRVLELLATYLGHGFALFQAPPLGKDTNATSPSKEYKDALLGFAGSHALAKAGEMASLSCASEVADGSIIARLSLELGAFVMKIAEPALAEHSKAFQERSIAMVMDCLPDCKLRVVHDKVLQTKASDELIPALIVGGDFAKLAFDASLLDFSGGATDVFDQLDYHKTLADFCRFVEVAQLSSSTHMPGVTMPSLKDKLADVPMHEAIVIMEVLVSIADLTGVACRLHLDLCTCMAGGKLPSKDNLLDFLVDCICAMKSKLTVADSLFTGDSAMKLEQFGVELPVSLATCRGWRDGMALFCGKAQSLLMSAWMTMLSESIGACKSATPSWSVCFKDGAFDMTMASKVLHGKLPSLVRAHNSTHELLKVIGRRGGGGGWVGLTWEKEGPTKHMRSLR